MQLVLFIALICFVALFIIVAIRMHLKNKSKELTEKLLQISAYSEKSSYEQAQERLSKLNDAVFIDIPADLNNVFYGKIISAAQEKDFTNHYISYFQEAYSLVKKLETFNIAPSVTISNLIRDFGNIKRLVKQHNDTVINSLLDTHKDFFDHCLKYPLDKQQRRSIVSEEDNCLAVSSAGSGKTSSIVGKVKYLTEIKDIAPHRILLISYTNKAAAELTERMATNGLKGYTFHKLAIDIIGKETGVKPSICDNTDALFIDIYHTLLGNEDFKKSVVEYFIDYQTNEADWEQRKNERREKLSEQKNVQLKAMFPDMDGRTIYVRSEQEQKICFVLSSLGVQFRYEEPYEHQLADEMHSQYRPDFSIYFEQKGVPKRIYLEHFGVDEHGLVPAWFAKDKNITYEEANQKYNDGITWKKTAHEKFGTQLLVTSSADFHYSDIKDKLKKILTDVGVPIQEKTDEELYDLVLAESAWSESTFALAQAGKSGDIQYPSDSLNDVLENAAQKLNKHLTKARIHSSDVFYHEDNVDDHNDFYQKHGCVCVEMESFALFHNASILGKKAACLLTISDSLVTHAGASAEERQTSFNNMMEVALEAAIQL